MPRYPMIRMALLTVLLIAPIYTIVSQEKDSKSVPVRVSTKDGATLDGQSLGVHRDTLMFQSNGGELLPIAMKDISDIEYLENGRGRNWFEHPNNFRYLLTSSAMPIEKKRLLLGTTYGIIATAHFGLTNRVTIGGGGDIVTRSLGFLNVKANFFSRRRHKLSGGIHFYRMPPDFIETYSGEDHRNFVLVSAASTWGNENNHLTLGAGYLYVFKGFIPPVVTVGGSVRILNRLALVTENWFLFVGEHTDIPVIISLGARYLSRRSAIDLAVYSDHVSRFDAFIPYLAYSIKVGKLRE